MVIGDRNGRARYEDFLNFEMTAQTKDELKNDIYEKKFKKKREAKDIMMRNLDYTVRELQGYDY